MKDPIEISAVIEAPIENVWQFWNKPIHVVNWSFASPEWCCPTAESDLRTGGRFTSRMEAKDGSMGFDFGGTYTSVIPNEFIAYSMDDNRKVEISFKTKNGQTLIVQKFEPETSNPREFQQAGWQAILNNFKNYAEAQ